MKFTLIALCPGFLMLIWMLRVQDHNYPADQQAGVAFFTFAVWGATWFVLAVYWGARIVKHVMGRKN